MFHQREIKLLLHYILSFIFVLFCIWHRQNTLVIMTLGTNSPFMSSNNTDTANVLDTLTFKK